MARLRWSPQAAADLDVICEFIARDSPLFAKLFARQVLSLVESLGKFPRSGRVVPEYGRPDIRERLFQNYRIVYRLSPGCMEIAAIVHGAQALMPRLRGRL